MVNSLELVNFQKHSKLKIDFKNGINVLYGNSHSGKSCIVRALRWIFFNDINSNAIRKEGTKETSVKVYLENGIWVERIKSDKKNQYSFQKDGTVHTFDAVGKDIPQEVKEILKVRTVEVDGQELNLNVSNQLDSPFLIGKEYTPTFRAKLFNLLTGNEFQDKIFKELNSDSRTLNSLEKSEGEEVEILTLKKQSLEAEVAQKDMAYQVQNKVLGRLRKKIEAYESYLKIWERLMENGAERSAVAHLQNRLQVIDIKQLRELESKIETYLILEKASRMRFKGQISKEAVLGEMAKTNPTAFNYAKLEGTIEVFEKLQTLYKRRTDTVNARNSIELTLRDAINSINEYDVAYSNLIKSLNLCDKCPLLRDK